MSTTRFRCSARRLVGGATFSGTRSTLTRWTPASPVWPLRRVRTLVDAGKHRLAAEPLLREALAGRREMRGPPRRSGRAWLRVQYRTAFPALPFFFLMLETIMAERRGGSPRYALQYGAGYRIARSNGYGGANLNFLVCEQSFFLQSVWLDPGLA